MFFDRESTVVITKLNNLTESALTSYCQNFGKVVRCFIKSVMQTRNKEPYALIKFAEIKSVSSILSHRNHTINGTHVIMRTYHQDTSNSTVSQASPSLMTSAQQNKTPPNNKNNNNNNKKNAQPLISYDQLVQENLALKFELSNVQKSLTEAQTYSKTAYETFQMLREKFEAEQALANKLKLEHAAMVESYEARLNQLPSSTTSALTSTNTMETEKVKEEPIDCHSRQMSAANHQLEVQIVKDRLEQAQIDLGKCQTENAILTAKLTSRDQQFEKRHKESSAQYTRLKKQYDHLSSCIKDFHSKLYPKKRLKTELKDENTSERNTEDLQHSEDSNDDVVEIVMHVEPMCT